MPSWSVIGSACKLALGSCWLQWTSVHQRSVHSPVNIFSMYRVARSLRRGTRLAAFFSTLLIVSGTRWQLEQSMFDRVRAACEDEDRLGPAHSSRLEKTSPFAGNSRSRYPNPQIYPGDWQPPSPNALELNQAPPGFDPPSTILFDKILERLSDSRVSPAERLADFRRIEADWGQSPPVYRLDDPRWKSYWIFQKFWAVNQGLKSVSTEFKSNILDYLARDRAEPLAVEFISGLKKALHSTNHFEKDLAQNLRTHIFKEDMGQWSDFFSF